MYLPGFPFTCKIHFSETNSPHLVNNDSTPGLRRNKGENVQRHHFRGSTSTTNPACVAIHRCAGIRHDHCRSVSTFSNVSRQRANFVTFLCGMYPVVHPSQMMCVRCHQENRERMLASKSARAKAARAQPGMPGGRGEKK